MDSNQSAMDAANELLCTLRNYMLASNITAAFRTADTSVDRTAYDAALHAAQSEDLLDDLRLDEQDLIETVNFDDLTSDAAEERLDILEKVEEATSEAVRDHVLEVQYGMRGNFQGIAVTSIELLFGTGGPASRVVIYLRGSRPTCEVQGQCWGTPWLATKTTFAEAEALAAYLMDRFDFETSVSDMEALIG